MCIQPYVNVSLNVRKIQVPLGWREFYVKPTFYTKHVGLTYIIQRQAFRLKIKVKETYIRKKISKSEKKDWLTSQTLKNDGLTI